MRSNSEEEKKKLTRRQVVLIATIISGILLLCLAIGLYVKGQDLETMKGRLETLEQRNEILEKENKDMRDLVVYNISEGIPLKKKLLS